MTKCRKNILRDKKQQSLGIRPRDSCTTVFLRKNVGSINTRFDNCGIVEKSPLLNILWPNISKFIPQQRSIDVKYVVKHRIIL